MLGEKLFPMICKDSMSRERQEPIFPPTWRKFVKKPTQMKAEIRERKGRRVAVCCLNTG